MFDIIKPCPNCNIDDEIGIGCRNGRAFVYCSACEMDGPEADNDDAAVAAWNALPRRADIERVERERDWLIKRISGKLCSEYKKDCPAMNNVNDFRCMECWSKAVEEATSCQK